MSQNNSNDKAAMLAKLEEINRIEGFDASVFLVDYTDLSTGEVRKRLPVKIQIAWFRLKYPEGRIAVSAVPVGDCFVATARVYPNYKDPEYAYLAEASASRAPCADKPSVSAREWAQTAAVGVALRNAGFGLQFEIAGEDFSETAPDELGSPIDVKAEQGLQTAQIDGEVTASRAEKQTPAAPAKEPTLEEKFQKAIQCPCPITKYNGKTLGDILTLDPKALKWIADKFTGDAGIQEAARTICEYASKQAAA